MTIMGLLWIILYCCSIGITTILIFGKPASAYKTRHGNGSRKKVDTVPLILVTSGAESYTGFLDSTELLDITGRTRKVPCDFSHLPYKYFGATGGYLPGLGPVVCGGSSEQSSDECYLLRRSVEGTLNLDLQSEFLKGSHVPDEHTLMQICNDSKFVPASILASNKQSGFRRSLSQIPNAPRN